MMVASKPTVASASLLRLNLGVSLQIRIFNLRNFLRAAFWAVLITSRSPAQTTQSLVTGNLTISPAVTTVTPTTMPGAEAMVYRRVGDAELRLFIVKPAGWKAYDKRPCLVAFFGGGWVGGTPEWSIEDARWGATRGMLGVAPDYRTKNRFHATPEDCVADGRAAVRWLQDHAGELGIDPTKMISLGASAGGHVAAWTAIPVPVSPAATADPIPDPPPAALVLLWPVTDTTVTGFGKGKPFGGDAARAAALSVTDRMPAGMPPTIVFHGTKDNVVEYGNSVAFVMKMDAAGNTCSLITFPEAPHSPVSSNAPDGKGSERRNLMYLEIEKFLLRAGLITLPGSR